MKRKLYLDFARVVAIFAVIMIHVLNDKYLLISSAGSLGSYVIIGTNSLFSFGVPLFLMISGAVFLDEDRKITIKKLLLHNFLRIVIVFFIWDFIYGLFVYSVEVEVSFKMFEFAILNMARFRYHLWFLPMIATIYLLVPLLRKICRRENKEVVKYGLILATITITIMSLSTVFEVNPVTNYFFKIIGLFNPTILCSYVLYFVLGWYLDQFINESKLKKPLLITGVCLIPISSFISILISYINNEKILLTENNFFIFTFLISIGVFILCKQLKFANRENKFIRSISDCSFGMYLTHVAIIEILEKFIPESLIFSGWGFLIIPGIFIITVAVSHSLTLLIKLIFRKYSRYLV